MASPKFRQVIGTGGIGGGILFELEGNRALSRNETRLANLSPAKDYCKLHIILHYISRILAPEVAVYAVGAVGLDRPGAELAGMMKGAGIDTAFVRFVPDKPTMYAVCLQYPDKSVCNVTTAGSASSLVNEGDAEIAFAGLPTRRRGDRRHRRAGSPPGRKAGPAQAGESSGRILRRLLLKRRSAGVCEWGRPSGHRPPGLERGRGCGLLRRRGSGAFPAGMEVL